jgi:hypothetical protein
LKKLIHLIRFLTRDLSGYYYYYYYATACLALLYATLKYVQLITVAERSEAWNFFAPTKTEIVASDSTVGMDVYVCVFKLFMLACA